LHRIAGLLSHRTNTIYDRAGGAPYLSRTYLWGMPRMPDGSPAFEGGQLRDGAVFDRPWGLFLHRFHRSDDDRALHNHPWRWAFSLILTGGYREERRVGDRVVRIDRKPGTVVRLSPEEFHRVDLHEQDAWSLFLAGPKVGSWGFWDRDTHEFWPWREFIAKIRSGNTLNLDVRRERTCAVCDRPLRPYEDLCLTSAGMAHAVCEAFAEQDAERRAQSPARRPFD
jgi:hypothetical protein